MQVMENLYLYYLLVYVKQVDQIKKKKKYIIQYQKIQNQPCIDLKY